jgi:hypothetical protein
MIASAIRSLASGANPKSSRQRFSRTIQIWDVVAYRLISV